MTLNENSVVEDAFDEETFISEAKFNFVPIDQLGPYVNGLELVDARKKTVVVSLWNELANNVGQKLFELADKSPVVAIKSLKVSDFQGVSLSALGKSKVLINPDILEEKKLRSWEREFHGQYWHGFESFI